MVRLDPGTRAKRGYQGDEIDMIDARWYAVRWLTFSLALRLVANN
jgi:hypothetical protein